MNPKHSFYNNYKQNIIYGLSLVLERALSFLIVPILGRELSPELYGIWTQSAGIIVFSANILMLSLPSAMIRYTSSFKRSDKINTSLKLILIFFPIFLIFGVFIYSFKDLISYFLWSRDDLTILLFPIYLWICSEAILEIFVTILRSDQKYYQCSFLYTLKYFLRLIILIVFAKNSISSLALAFEYIALTQLALSTPFLVMLLKEINLTNFTKIKNIISLGTKVTLLAILSYFSSFSDRFLIVHKLSLDDLTPYAIAFSISGIIALIYSALGFTLYPQLARLNDKNINLQNIFRENFYIYFTLGMSFIGFLGFQGSEIILFLTNKQVYVSNLIIFIISLSIFINGIQQMYQYIQVFKSSLWSTNFSLIISGIVCFILNWFFLENYGIKFASITLLLGSVITLSIILFYERNIFPKLNLIVLLKFLTIGVLSSYLADFIYIQISIIYLLAIKFIIQCILLIIFDYISGKSFINLVFKRI